MTSIDGQHNWDRERGFVAPARPQSHDRDPALATIARKLAIGGAFDSSIQESTACSDRPETGIDE